MHRIPPRGVDVACRSSAEPDAIEARRAGHVSSVLEPRRRRPAEREMFLSASRSRHPAPRRTASL